MDKLIITAAVVGSNPTKEMNPAVPYTPTEIAREAIECWRAGAAIAHIHVRDPETGEPAHENGLFGEVVDQIRAECDILLNLTTSGFNLDGEDVTERRLAPVDLAPELCSLDIGSVNFKEQAFINPPSFGRLAAARMGTAGVKPEIEVFEIGHIAQARALIEEGLIQDPPYFQLCMGVGWGIPATVENMRFMHSKLPSGAVWSALGVGRAQDAIIVEALGLGGHVRVGFEDNLYLEKGVLASSNAQFVDRLRVRAEEMGRSLASPADAKLLLGLS